MQRRSLSVLSIGWFSTVVLPPFAHPTVQSGPGRSRGEFILFPGDGSWSIFVQEFQTVSPLLAHRLAQDSVGAQVANDPLLNPYSEAGLDEFVTFLMQAASKRDLIVLGYCLGEAMRRVQALPEVVRRKVVVTYWDPIPGDHAAELLDLGTLGAVSRRQFMDWLVDRVSTREATAIEASPDDDLDHVHQTEALLEADGAGLGV